MKMQIVTIILLSLIGTFTQAQNGPLRGSGKVVQKNFDFKNFDTVNFDDLDGKLEIEVGKEYSIAITIDDNLENLLSVENNKSELTVSLRGNRDNKLYIENTKISVKITMPAISGIRNNGNASLTVNNISGKYLKMDNRVNGSAIINGTIDKLEIKNSGNGNLDATKLIAKNAEVSSRGNGSVKVNATETLTASASGNGNVVNTGKAKFDANSSKSGNGRLIQP